jgi:hypothetical protein
MSKRKSEILATGSSDLTSTGMPWSKVPNSLCPYTEWLDGRHGPAKDTLPSVDQFPIPEVTRRSILMGAASSAIFAPSIVRNASLMNVGGLLLPMQRPSAGFVERLRFQYLDGALRRGWDEQREGRVVGGISEVKAMEAVACARKNGWLPISRFATSNS